MRTARHLFVERLEILERLVPCLLAVALSVTPAAAQIVHQLAARDQLHPALGAITDDPGPFNRFQWTRELAVNQFYVPLPATQAPDIDEGQETSPATESPTVMFNPVSGHPVAIWTSTGHGNTGGYGASLEGDVLFSHFAVGGWTGPTVLAAGARDPSLTIDPANGQTHLVYWTPGDNGAVWHRQASVDLGSWSDPVRVSDRRESAVRPTVLIHGNTLQIAYESHLAGIGSTPREIVVASSTMDRADFSRKVVAMTDYAGRNWVRLDSDGRRLLVRWLNDEHQAGWTLRGVRRIWGPVGLQPRPVGTESRYRARPRRR